MTERSARADVRNPLLALPEARELLAMPDCPVCHARSKFRALLLAIRRKAHADADKSWSKRKGPMALYWRCVGVYVGHIGRLFR